VTTHPGLDTTVVRVAAVEPPSYAGHGPWATTPLHLLRLGMCNLACDWCEVPETVAILGADLDTTAPYITIDALVERLDTVLDTAPETPLLITGGEPLLQDHAILELSDRLADRWPLVDLWVETNGTRPPPDWWLERVARTLVSPKVGTRDPQRKRLPGHALEAWATLARTNEPGSSVVAFDFTCGTRSDVLHTARICTWLELAPCDVTITPRAGSHARRDHCTVQQASLNIVYGTALEHGFALTPRPLRSTL
jgi:7-carboxy-7-deazaguanine synthase